MFMAENVFNKKVSVEVVLCFLNPFLIHQDFLVATKIVWSLFYTLED